MKTDKNMCKFYQIKRNHIIIAITIGIILMIITGIAFLKNPAPWNIFGIGIGYGITVLALEIILNSKKENQK